MSAIVRVFARQDLLQDKYKHTGRTTRLCDAFIQKLFQNVGKEIQIYDHYVTYSSDKMLTEKIINRLKLEHSHVKWKVRKGNGCIFMSITDYRE